MKDARLPVALSERRIDILLMAFFALNLLFITYNVDLEQLVIANPYHFVYPFWPTPVVVNLVHWYGTHFDPLLMARPAWWKATIWIDVLAFGPFYAVALYAFAAARDWIRLPTVAWAFVMLTNVTIILYEEAFGPHAAPHLLFVLADNFLWVAVPVLAVARMAVAEHPFTRSGADAHAFRQRYGPWALVAGGSEGLGQAFARSLAARGLHLVLVARRGDRLETLATDIRTRFGVSVRTTAGDLADSASVEAVLASVSDIEVGLLVVNAAHAPVGELVASDWSDAERAVAVNVRAPLRLVHALGGAMARRGRGGIVLMASFAGLQGSPTLAAYGATKAFSLALAEALWAELRPSGVDVLACCAGAIRTPGFQQAASRPVPGSLDAVTVAQAALNALGRGPRTIPGGLNRVAAFLTTRILTRRRAVLVMKAMSRSIG